MTKRTHSVSEATKVFPRLLRMAEGGELVEITQRGGTVAYLVSRQHLEAILETIELLANPRARKAIDAHRAGRTKWLPPDALR